MARTCTHLDQRRVLEPTAEGCEDCLRTGTKWVSLRMCESCGRVGCCDSSPGKHARGHFHATRHPIIRSVEPGEDWEWCYVDETYVGTADEAAA